MRRRTRRIISIIAPILSVFWTAVSAILQFVGVAPKELAERLLGPSVVAFLRSIAGRGMTEQGARISLIVLGDLSFAIGCLFFLLIPMMRIWRRQDELKQQIDSHRSLMGTEHTKIRQETEDVITGARQKLVRAQKAERSARHLHQMTREMLKKWRREKLSD